MTDDKKSKTNEYIQKQKDVVEKYSNKDKRGRESTASENARTQRTTSWNDTPPPPPKRTKPKE